MMPEEFHHGRFLSWLALEKRSREKARRNRRLNSTGITPTTVVSAFSSGGRECGMLPKCGLTSMPGHEALAMFLPIMILGFLAAFA